MISLTTRPAVKAALVAVAAMVATGSLATVSEAGSPQKPTNPAAIQQQNSKPATPGLRGNGTNASPAAKKSQQEREDEIWLKACLLSDGGISTNPDGSTSCTKADGTRVW